MMASFFKLTRFALLSLICGAIPLMFAEQLAAQSPAVCTVTVHVAGIRNANGDILVSLQRDAVNVVDSRVVEIDPKTMTATAVFKNVPEGVYGLFVVHDENKNGMIDMDTAGIPLEGYGFSNNPATKAGPPSFDEFKFQLKQPGNSLDIKLIYWP